MTIQNIYIISSKISLTIKANIELHTYNCLQYGFTIKGIDIASAGHIVKTRCY